MDFLDEKLEAYIEAHTEKEPETLAELNRETWLKVLNPRMLAGHLQGRVISMFSHMIQPAVVLEIGSYTGYSSICWAEGLQEDGIIHTIDLNEELETMVNVYHEKAGIKDKVHFHIGNALDIIPTIKETIDVVFIDADKNNYCNYFDLVFDKVRKGGYIIADNVLWSGKVLNKAQDMDADTKGIDAYNKKIQGDSRIQNVLFPVRDGLMVARKL